MISILYKLLFKEILKYMGLVLILVIFIYLAVDFFEKIDDFIEAGISMSRVSVFFIYKIPLIIQQIMPVSLLISVLIVLGLMNRNNEIIALKSSGISVYYLLTPVFIIGVLSTLFLFFLSEKIIPITIPKANEIWMREVKKKRAVLSRDKNIWIKGEQSITYIKYYNNDKKQIFGITRSLFDKDFRLRQRIDSPKAYFKNGKWIFEDALVQQFKKESGDFIVTSYKQLKQKLSFLPDDLKQAIKQLEEMSIGELIFYIKKIEAEGYDASRYKVDFHSRIAFPMICIIMALIGTGTALKVKTKDSMPVSIAYGIGIAFLYWFFHSFCLSLGYGGMLPVWLASWSSNLLFLSAGAFILIKAE